MSSAEVFSWGSLGPDSGVDTPAPVRVGRRGLVRHVHAGARGALLAGAQVAEWLPTQSGLSHENVGDCGAVPRNSPGVKCAAFGLDHALLLREIGTEGDGGVEPKTEILGWGSGEQGQVMLYNPVCRADSGYLRGLDPRVGFCTDFVESLTRAAEKNGAVGRGRCTAVGAVRC